MSEFFEMLMVLSFGASWPLSILKSYKSRSTKGKSLFFMLLILIGYACGIIAKLTANNLTYVFVFYVLNLIMVSIDVILYFRNQKIEKTARM